MNDESLSKQLKNDIYTLLSTTNGYSDIVVKDSYSDYPTINYPMVVIYELENSDNSSYYDGKEHVVDVGYQIDIYAGQSETLSARDNVRNIINIIKNYMRGERYHALQRLGDTPIVPSMDDADIQIGYMRYIGRIDIDTHTIYRRN